MELRRLVTLFAIAAAATLVLRACVVEGIYIASGSMEPKFPVGAHVFLDKLTYRFRAPRRGEIICLVEPVPPRHEVVKRVIGVQDDVIELRAKAVFVNGAAADEPYVRHSRAAERLAGDDLGPLTVPKDQVFVLGDNRDESNDSSVWKDPDSGQPVHFVPVSRVRGIVRGFY